MTQSVFTADALAGEIVLVTGASRGIGAAILDVCVKAGATVIGTATSRLRRCKDFRSYPGTRRQRRTAADFKYCLPANGIRRFHESARSRLRFRYRVSEQRRHHSRYAFHAYERFSVG